MPNSSDVGWWNQKRLYGRCSGIRIDLLASELGEHEENMVLFRKLEVNKVRGIKPEGIHVIVQFDRGVVGAARMSRFENKHLRNDDTSNPEADQLQQQKTTSGSSPVSQEQRSEATVYEESRFCRWSEENLASSP